MADQSCQNGNNSEQIFRGLIPWDLEDFLETLKAHVSLFTKIPPRDWKKIEAGIRTIDEKTGEEEIYELNSESPIVQLMEYLAERHEFGIASSHFVRFIKIIQFISANQQQLIKDKWCHEESYNLAISNMLYAALCILPYSDAVESSEGEEDYQFNYEEVVKKANEILASR